MLMQGDCKEMMSVFYPDNYVDSVVTDPPYELGFLGKGSDSTGIAYHVAMWEQVYRVLKPGGYLLAFGGTRTYHRLVCAIEEAGFEIRDQIMWLYGSGFPKHYSALKPAHEPIVVARKPLIGTVAKNVEEYGTGAMNIEGSRVGERWPTNVIHDGLSEEWSKFFYCAKASQKERNAGLDALPEVEIAAKGNGLARTCESCGASTLDGCDCPDRTFSNPKRKNFHPTVKPLELMQYLIKLVTPPHGRVLDPFMGSGTTAVAAQLEGFKWVGCEITKEYIPIVNARVEWAKKQPKRMLNDYTQSAR